jgi:hypothetical protein
MVTLNDFDSDIAAVTSAAEIVKRDILSIQKLCGELTQWTTAAMKLNSEPLIQIAPCARQVDLGLIQTHATQIYQATRRLRDALDKAAETFLLLDRDDQRRALELHPEIEQDATLYGVIRAQTFAVNLPGQSAK